MTDPDRSNDDELASRLRFSVARLARMLRQQDQSGFGPTLLAALATIERHGPITLGELAGREQVAPPTITKVVEKLETHGLVTRTTDLADRRVNRVTVTTKGTKQLAVYRSRRTEWLASRLQGLTPDERQQLIAALPLLERLIEVQETRP
jgi:DNA-binding MarR family transcriptional regulator